MDVKHQGQGNECSTDIKAGPQEKAWNKSSLELVVSQLVLIHQPSIFFRHREHYQSHKSHHEQHHSLRTPTCSHTLSTMQEERQQANQRYCCQAKRRKNSARQKWRCDMTANMKMTEDKKKCRVCIVFSTWIS